MRHRRIAFIAFMVMACSDAPTTSLLVARDIEPHLALAPSIPVFGPPFVGSFMAFNFMDHATPLQGSNTDGIMMTFWGERLSMKYTGIDGHSGYDWAMPTGVAIRAVYPGKVVFAGTQPKFYCAPLGRYVSDQIQVVLEHTIPTTRGSEVVRTRYVHLSRAIVSTGQIVAAGALLGPSGSTGCSLNPHLHFETLRKNNLDSTYKPIDPYGWQLSATDPWITAGGAESIYLWNGKGPELYKEVTLAPNPTGSTAVVVITKVRLMGVDDPKNLNNEFIELSIDLRHGSSASLNGFQIRGDVMGFVYNIPSGITLSASNPTVRIYTGSGTNSSSTLYMGRTSQAWSNKFDDCARRVNTNNGLQYVVKVGGVACQ